MAYLMVLTVRMILQTKSCMYSNEVHRKTYHGFIHDFFLGGGGGVGRKIVWVGVGRTFVRPL